MGAVTNTVKAGRRAKSQVELTKASRLNASRPEMISLLRIYEGDVGKLQCSVDLTSD